MRQETKAIYPYSVLSSLSSPNFCLQLTPQFSSQNSHSLMAIELQPKAFDFGEGAAENRQVHIQVIWDPQQ